MYSGLSAKRLINFLMDSYPKLSNLIPESDLPIIKKNSVSTKIGGSILGEGHYGVVLTSNDPNKIVKITTDVSEATFASTYIEKNWINDPSMIGFARYYHCFCIGKIKKSFFGNKKEINVYFISRESTETTERPILNKELITTRNLFASRNSKAYQYLEKDMLTMSRDEIVKKLRDINKLRSLNSVVSILDLANLSSKAMDALSTEETYEAYISLRELIDRYNIYICDLHYDNFRMAYRNINDENKLINVVSDPGHMFVMPWSDITNPKSI